MATPAILHPVDYTSRDYLALREDLIAILRSRIPEWLADDPADFGIALVEAMAYMGDMLNYYIDRSAAETFLGTASQRQSLLNLSSLLGYAPSGRVAAEVAVTFVNSSEVVAVVPGGAQITTAIRTSDANIPLTYEVAHNPDSPDGSWTIQPRGNSLVIPAVEGVTVTNEILGQSNGYAGQTFTIRDAPLVNRSLSIRVGADAATATPYTYVQNLYEATPTEDRFTYRTDDIGVTTVMFGDGISGTVPQISQNIFATYRIGGGVIGNISPGQSFVPVGWTFLGTITNQTKAHGGVDEESNEQIREAAFTAFRTRNSAVTKQDFQDLAQADNRILKAKARGNSLGNIKVYVAPISPGTDPHPGFDAYSVIARSLSNNVASLVLSETPQFTSRQITVSGMGEPWDGTYTATASGGNTITYPRTSVNRSALAASGTVTLGELPEFADTREAIRLKLQERGAVGSIVQVLPYTFRDIKLKVEIGIRPQFRQKDAIASTKAALNRLFSYENTPFNLTVRAHDIHAYLTNNVPEVWYATVELFDGPGSTTAVDHIIAHADQIVRVLGSNMDVNPSDADPGITHQA